MESVDDNYCVRCKHSALVHEIEQVNEDGSVDVHCNATVEHGFTCPCEQFVSPYSDGIEKWKAAHGL